MSNKKLSKPEEWEAFLDFAQSYIASAIALINCFGLKPSFKTFKNYDKAYVLSAHFLMAHGVELYLKFLIYLLGGGTPEQTHVLKNIISELDPLYGKFYKRSILSEKLMKEIDILDKYEQFRYTFDRNWKYIPDIVDQESKKWTGKYASSRTKKWIEIKDRLNDTGYHLSKKMNL